MELLWDMIEGFRHNRPMPGLPIQAYSDAENIYRAWKGMEWSWNDLMTAELELDVDQLEEIVGYAFLNTCAFAYDTVKAAEYVIRYKTSFAIPWQGSVDRLEGYDFEPDQLGKLHSIVLQELNDVMEKLSVFDKEFVGVPADAIVEVTPERIATVRGFDDVLKEIGVVRAPEP